MLGVVTDVDRLPLLGVASGTTRNMTTSKTRYLMLPRVEGRRGRGAACCRARVAKAGIM